MKIRYKGGHTVKVFNPESREYEEKPSESLEQLFEETQYVFPKAGAVLSVDDGIGSWLLAKHPRILEAIPDRDRAAPKAAPRVIVAVVAEDAKGKGKGKDKDEDKDEPQG